MLTWGYRIIQKNWILFALYYLSSCFICFLTCFNGWQNVDRNSQVGELSLVVAWLVQSDGLIQSLNWLNHVLLHLWKVRWLLICQIEFIVIGVRPQWCNPFNSNLSCIVSPSIILLFFIVFLELILILDCKLNSCRCKSISFLLYFLAQLEII